TAVMVSEWMRVGFVHGVMNTDNMSILGLTIDYGPYGWLEGYELQWTPNTTDLPGRRYCYGNQPNIAQWNLVRLANALHPLIPETKDLERGLDAFIDTFHEASARMMADKLGLASLDQPGDDRIVGGLLELLQKAETDMTIFYRNLANVPLGEAEDGERLAPLRPAFYGPVSPEHESALGEWLRRYAARA